MAKIDDETGNSAADHGFDRYFHLDDTDDEDTYVALEREWVRVIKAGLYMEQGRAA